MRYFDKDMLRRLKNDAKMVNLDFHDYMIMITSIELRNKHRINWLENHERFVDFCLVIKDDIINKINKDRNNIAIIDINDMIIFIENYCVSINGLGIYSKKELMMGLYFYFIDIGIDVSTEKDINHIQFRKIIN